MRIIELLENDFYLLSFINAPRLISVLKVTIQNQHQTNQLQDLNPMQKCIRWIMIEKMYH